MTSTWLALFLVALGALMYARGVVYTLWPSGKMAEKRRRKNLRYGMPTDMKRFGARVRRVGFLLALAGAWIVAWEHPS